jgi:hypothetical protein
LNQYCESINHDSVSGDFKSWSQGGISINEITTVPTGITVSYKHTCESASLINFRQSCYLIDAGKTLSLTGYFKLADDHSAYAPRLEILDPASDPILGGTALATGTVGTPGGSANWQTVTVSYQNTTTQPLWVIIRASCKHATGIVYEAVRIDSQDLPSASSVVAPDTVGYATGTYDTSGIGGNSGLTSLFIMDNW